MEDPETVEMLNVFYSLDFTAEAKPQESWTLDLREEGWRKKGISLVREGWVRDQLSRFNTHKSMGPDERYPWVLRELADVAKSLSIIFEKPWRTGEVSSYRTKKSVTPMLKGPEGGPGKLLPSQPQLLPWKGNGRDHSGGPEGSSAIKATAAYNKRNGKMNQFPLN